LIRAAVRTYIGDMARSRREKATIPVSTWHPPRAADAETYPELVRLGISLIKEVFPNEQLNIDVQIARDEYKLLVYLIGRGEAEPLTITYRPDYILEGEQYYPGYIIDFGPFWRRNDKGEYSEEFSRLADRFCQVFDAPPSSPADTPQPEGMGDDDLNTKVKKAKAENLARAKPRPKRRSSTHQLANYRALVQNVDLENPALSVAEQRRRANRLLTAYDRLRDVRPNFKDSNPQLTAARRIKKAAHRERQNVAKVAATVAFG
jgi:hypothetical protein